jgi:preprotein translocase subunit SecF
MPFVSRRLTWFASAGVLALAAIVLIVVRGVSFDADLRGAGSTPWVALAIVLASAAGLAAYFRSWRIGLAALVATAFVLLVVLGVFAARGWPITAGALAALAAVTLFAIHEQAVVFDAVVDELPGREGIAADTRAQAADKAANSLLRRTIMLTIKVALVTLAIGIVAGWIMGARGVCDVTLTLLVGFVLASASALFIAVPLDVTLHR